MSCKPGCPSCKNCSIWKDREQYFLCWERAENLTYIVKSGTSFDDIRNAENRDEKYVIKFGFESKNELLAILGKKG